MTVQADHGFVYPTWTFGDRVRKARDMADMNQRDFSAAIGTTEGSLATWETGRSKPRDIVAIAKRVEMLTHIPASWLLGIDDPPAPGPNGPGARKLPRMDSNHQPPGCTSANPPPAKVARFTPRWTAPAPDQPARRAS